MAIFKGTLLKHLTCSKLIQWIFLLGLFGVSFIFMKSCFEKFSKKTTSYTISTLHPYDGIEFPTVTLCLGWHP